MRRRGLLASSLAFTRPAGGIGPVSSPRFSTETAAKGHSNPWNGEYQFYVDPEQSWSNGFTPFALADGCLRIRAQRTGSLGFQAGEVPDDPLTRAPYDWVSGVLTSRQRFSQQGGYFEIDAKMPKGRGTWPAFWLLPTDEAHPPEIDIAEYLGHEPTRYRGTCISAGPTFDQAVIDVGLDLSADFHRYGILWTDTDICFFLDGARMATKSIAGRREYWQPFYLLVNLAIGSRKADWVPAPDETTPSPVDLLVRRVRVWQRNGPRQIVLSATAVSEMSAPGTLVANLSCTGVGLQAAARYNLPNDACGRFAVSGRQLVTQAALCFRRQPYHDVLIQVTDWQGRTWLQPVSITVLDDGIAPNALADGSGQSLRHPAWSLDGVRIVTVAEGELVLEEPGIRPHVFGQLIEAAASARYIVVADFKLQRQTWVKFEVADGQGRNIQVYFDLSTGRIGDRFASPDPSPLVLNDCRMTAMAGGFWRCQADLTTSTSKMLRPSFKIVTGGSDYGLHSGGLARKLVSRPRFRVVAIG